MTLGENANGPEDYLRPRKLSPVTGSSNQLRSGARRFGACRPAQGTLQRKLADRGALRLWYVRDPSTVTALNCTVLPLVTPFTGTFSTVFAGTCRRNSSVPPLTLT